MRVVGLGVAFATGLALGAWLAGVLRPSSEPDVPRGEERSDTSPASSAVLEARRTPSRDAADPSAGPLTGAASDPSREPAEATQGEDGLGYVEVSVRTASGEEVRDGTVYALPAGAPGVDDSELLPTADLGEVLIVVGEGSFDVGVRTELGGALARDVRVERGRTSSVRLTIAGGRPVSFRVEGSLPASPPRGWIAVDAWARPSSPTPEFPGRDDGLQTYAHVRLDEQGRGATVPLLPGSYTVGGDLVMQARLDQPGEAARIERVEHPYALEPSVPLAAPGDEVSLRVRVEDRRSLRITWDKGPEPWPDVPLAVRVRVEDGSRSEDRVLRTHEYGDFQPRTFAVRSGKARIAWSGEGIAPGSLEVEVPPGPPVERTVSIRYDRATLPVSPEPLHVTIEGLGARESAAFYGALDPSLPPDAWVPLADWATLAENGTRVLPPAWRRAALVVAVVGDRLASGPTAMPRTGPLHVTLEPAGLVVVVPEQRIPPAAGSLTLRLPDGRPIPSYTEYWGGEAPEAADAAVRPGQILGPLPRGRYRFEVRVGDRRLPDAEVEVVPGRLAVLRLRL